MNLPNILTLLRILLIPVFVIFIMNKQTGWALVTFAIAGITDGIDGLLARVTHQRTELGAYLDPIADKLLLSASYITLAIIEMLPSWLTVIVITRDVIILVGLLVFILTGYRPKLQPSLVSKMTTLFQISTILLSLLKEYHPSIEIFATFILYAAAALTVISGAHYIYLGTRILNEKKN
jgi:cardiolipin synthase